MYPENYRYTKEHEWVLIEDGVGTVGITDHAQSALGDIVYVDLPKVGRELRPHDTFGVVESIKAVSDLYSPAAGKVVAVNSALIDDPAQVNRDPHGEAWMIRMELSGEATGLMDATAYEAYVATLK